MINIDNKNKCFLSTINILMAENPALPLHKKRLILVVIFHNFAVFIYLQIVAAFVWT